MPRVTLTHRCSIAEGDTLLAFTVHEPGAVVDVPKETADSLIASGWAVAGTKPVPAAAPAE